MTSLIPLFARVLVKRENIKTSLIVPMTAKKDNAPARGTVLAVGETADKSIKPGMTVLFGMYAGTYLETVLKGTGIDATDLYLLNDEDILVALQESDDNRKAA